MRFRGKKLLLTVLITFLTISTLSTFVLGATMTQNFDTTNGTIIEIKVKIDSVKSQNGLNEFEIIINLIELNSDAVSIFSLEIDYKLGTHFSNTEIISENLTQTGQTLNTISSYEYDSVWAEVNLEIRIKFNEHREIGGQTIVYNYESDWLLFFTLEPRTFLDNYLWIIITGGSVAAVLAGTGMFLRGRMKSRIKKKRLPKRSKDLFSKFFREASTEKTSEYTKTWKEYVVSLHKINPNITSKSVHRLSRELLNDILGELSEDLMLRLQMTMDNKSKLAQTLSNLLKTMKSTNEGLISNIK